MSAPETSPRSIHDAESGVRLLAYIYKILRVRYGYQGQPALPYGLTPEDLAANTLQALRTGGRKLDPARPLTLQLFETASSVVSSLHRCKEPRLTGHDLETKGATVASSEPTPAQAFETFDAKAGIIAALRQHPLGKDDPDFQKVLDAFDRRLEKPADIAAFTGLPVERVYHYKKELKKIYPAFHAQMLKQGILQS